jgi:hypothetical protein
VSLKDLHLTATLTLPEYQAAIFEDKDGNSTMFKKFPRTRGSGPRELGRAHLDKLTATRAELLERVETLTGKAANKRWIFKLGHSE